MENNIYCAECGNFLVFERDEEDNTILKVSFCRHCLDKTRDYLNLLEMMNQDQLLNLCRHFKISESGFDNKKDLAGLDYIKLKNILRGYAFLYGAPDLSLAIHESNRIR